MLRPADSESSYSEHQLAPIETELTPRAVLNAVALRMKHVVEECPKRNVIFEVNADVSEDVLVRVVQKLSSKYAQIDVVTSDEELPHLVVNRLAKDLGATTVVERNDATKMRGTWSRDAISHDYSLAVGTLSSAMRAEFGRDVREEKEENHAIVLYRTESMLDGRGVLEAHPVHSVELKITPLLGHIYRLVDLLDDREIARRLREFIKRYSDRFLYRFVASRLGDLIRSAKISRDLVQGTHFAFVQKDGKMGLIATSPIERQHLAIRQFLQIHHSLPVSPLRIATLRRSPLHLLKSYPRVMGVFRRGGYELRQWLPFLTQLEVYPSRVYPHNAPVTPIYALPASATISEWIVHVEKLMGTAKKVPQRGVRLIVCPSTAAMHQLWRYLKYSHDAQVSLMTMVICTGPAEQLERAIFGRTASELVAVLTTAAHFETWHTSRLLDAGEITVFLGTPSGELQYLRRAYRFAHPIANVITVPLEKGADDRSPNDSGFESDSSGAEEQRVLCAQALSTVANRSNWAKQFMTEMWDRGDWKAPLSCPEDAEYYKCVEWMRRKWKDQKREDQTMEKFDAWRDITLGMYSAQME